jgi:hypothetical protein
MENLQIHLSRLGESAFGNEIINPTKSRTICFTKVQIMEPLNYSLRAIVIPKVSNCKYLQIIVDSDLS